MVEQPRRRDADDRTGGGSPPRTPRWVWVSAIGVGVLIVLAIVLMLLNGGQHGPGRHLSSGSAPTSGVAQDAEGSSTALAGVRR